MSDDDQFDDPIGAAQGWLEEMLWRQEEECNGDSSQDDNSSAEGDIDAAMRLHVSGASAAVRILELMRERSTSTEWARWLSRPLEHAAAVGDQDLTTDLMLAGAFGKPALTAVTGRQPKLLAHLLSNGEGLHQAGSDGASLLHHAARLGHDDVVETLLDAGADPTRVGGLGMSPLGVASNEGRVGVIAVIAARYPDTLNQNDTKHPGYAAVHHAAAYNQAGSIEALVRAGASLETRDRKGRTALHIAAMADADCEAAVDALLRHGADKESLNTDGLTPLLLAIEMGNEGAATVLIEAGANCLVGGRSAGEVLEMAVRCENVSLLRALVQGGLDPNSVGARGNTPLHLAAWKNSAPAIDFLIEAGANVEAKREENGVTPFHMAADSETEGDVTAIAALARHGADINAKMTSSGDTPLHIAARNYDNDNSVGVVDTLLKAGADETIVNSSGHTPEWAVEMRFHTIGRGFYGEDRKIKALLRNAPRNRANRAWARRRFVVMCRAFPDRVRLDPAPTSGDDPKRAPPTASSREGSARSANGTTGFAEAMGRLLGLQAEMFRVVVKYL